MGKDKYENEDLIKYGQPEDCWFHVDDLSSAHVYLRLKPRQTLNDIPGETLIDCCSLVKANSIVGCKKSSVYVVYTRWKNLKKTSDMVDGQVGFHRPENVRRIEVQKNNPIVKALNKTKEERYPDLYAEQQDRLRQIQQEKKEQKKKEEKEARIAAAERRRLRDEPVSVKMVSETGVQRKAEDAAEEGYEEDFFFDNF